MALLCVNILSKYDFLVAKEIVTPSVNTSQPIQILYLLNNFTLELQMKKWVANARQNYLICDNS